MSFIGRAGLLALLLAASTGPALAEKRDAWHVDGRLLGKDGEKAEDVSGMACATDQGFPRLCVVIDDNVQHAQFVEVHDGEIIVGKPVDLIANSFEGKALELDGEAVAFADGFYYVIGSHGHPRDKKGKLKSKANAAEIRARIAASSQIVRFREDGAGVDRSARLRDIIAADRTLRPFMDKRLEKNGLTIEGLAFGPGGKLFVGFRGPVLSGNRAVVLSVGAKALFEGGDDRHETFRLRLGPGRGVRDLTSFAGSLLILAGPAADEPGSYALYLWNGRSEKVRLLAELPFKGKRKPEAVLPLDVTKSKLRALVLFDSEKEGSPTPVEVPLP
ncbi:DUF3616 domain-containing protein [Bradyrhizobium sp. NBAIM03]|uniref:DUF3616 domain-containing protein n=1 Tax=Bradyrhizobium sp. NBAIM03 TaxID=2793816 RepID=UPI001CD6FFCC|nr:DUF3616 domain-containing protein [Bradyrhizobium sp. NBAIM03]MCA1536150.1 DUF3616 domain-containing protein [Bradyrhizobium sp. NBAIM03]